MEKVALRFLVFFLALIAAFPSNGAAQSEGSDFFKRDFAGSPLDGSGERSKGRNVEQTSSQVAPKRPTAVASFDEIGAPDAATATDSSPIAIAPTAGGDSGGESAESRNSALPNIAATSVPSQPSSASSVASKQAQGKSDDSSSAQALESVGRGIKIERLGLVANFLNEDHALEALTKYREVLVEHQLEPGNIYMMGITPGIMLEALTNMVRRLQFLGVSFSSNQIEPPVPVKLSPSWIIETATGRYLVEGTFELGRFLNSRGEFIKPGDAELPLGSESVTQPDLGAASSVAGKTEGANGAASRANTKAESVTAAASSASSERQGIVPDLR